MKRDFIPGVEVVAPSFFGGESESQWVADEDGALRLEAAQAEWRAQGHGWSVTSPTDEETADLLAGLAWQHELEARLSTANVDHGLRAQFLEDEWSRSDCEPAGVAGVAVGLVSVLSTQTRGKNSPRSARKPFRVAAETTAAVEAVGAFVAGGDSARMGKLRRAIGFAARGHGALNPGHRPDEVRMVTLTYRAGVAWEPNQVRSVLDTFRKWHARRELKMRYVWVAEIQDGKRRTDGGMTGAVHYHLAFWVPVGTPHFPKADTPGKAVKSRDGAMYTRLSDRPWWPHGSTRTELANGAVGYLMHYLKKGNSKHFGLFPEGCRIYSVGGLEHSMRRARRWLGLPAFVQGNSSYADDWRRVVGGGWCSPDGELFASEFRRINCGGVFCLQRVATHARSIEAAGPFAWLTDKPVGLPC